MPGEEESAEDLSAQTHSDEVLAPRARRYHRRSLWLFVGIVAAFLLATSLVSLPPVALTAAYIVLLLGAANLMWATMNMMIKRRGED